MIIIIIIIIIIKKRGPMLILELLGVFGAQAPLQKKNTLMTEPLVNSALAQFVYRNLLSAPTDGFLEAA